MSCDFLFTRHWLPVMQEGSSGLVLSGKPSPLLEGVPSRCVLWLAYSINLQLAMCFNTVYFDWETNTEAVNLARGGAWKNQLPSTCRMGCAALIPAGQRGIFYAINALTAQWARYTLRHAKQIAMEAILACHPGWSTEWLDWVANSCEPWRIHTGLIAIVGLAWCL